MNAAKIVLLLGLCLGAIAQVPQVPITGNLGAGGSFPLLNSPGVVFTSDANHTMVYPEMSGSSGFLQVTSTVALTATRNLVAPLTKGFVWVVENATTGGQSIQILGPSGGGVTIPNGAMLLVGCDGVNYVAGYSSTGVTTFSAPPGSWPSWLTPSVTNPTTSPQLTVAAAPIPNGALQHYSTNVNGQDCPLGGTCTISGTGYSLGGTLSSSNVSLSTIISGASATVSGLDGSHIVTLHAGSTDGGYLLTVVFTASRGHTSYCVVTPSDPTAGEPSDVQSLFVSSESDTSYALSVYTSVTSPATLSWNVSCP